MKLNKTDYVLERASDGGYYAWLTVNMQCNAYGESPEEAVLNLQETMNEMIDEMDNGKWIMDNGELMMPFCIEIFHYPFFIIYLFNTQFINNVGGSCIFIDNK